jgi:hypothetical protein
MMAITFSELFQFVVLLHQLNVADKAKTERKFIKEERRRNTCVLQGFLT